MLDQNTDRMWYVIGALVVGAGIIILVNKTMPEVFANITKTYKGTTDSATKEIEEAFANPNLLKDHANMDKLEGWGGSKVTYTSNISVPEWNTSKAVRVQTTGGTSNTKVFRKFITDEWMGKKATMSVYIKNLSDKPMTFYRNGVANSFVNVNPGEAKRIVGSGEIRTEYNFVQYQYESVNPEDNLDFLLYGQKLELGNHVTAYEE